MKFGLGSNMYMSDTGDVSHWERTVEQALVMEKCGFDFFAFGERHLYDNGFPEPLTTMTGLLAKTTRLKTASFLLLPLYEPLRLAEVTATLDWMSKGRFIFGAGLGYRPAELTSFGVPRRTRASRFEEALVIVKRLWTERRVTFHGKHFNYDDVFVSPKPYQKPHPPILVGGASSQSIRRAAKWGDGWWPGVELSKLPDALRFYRSCLKAHGKDPSKTEVVGGRDGFIADDRETAKETMAGPYIKLIDNYRRWENPHVSWWPELDFDEMVRENRVFIGDADDWIANVERQKKIGITMFNPRFDYTGIPRDKVLAAIKLFGQKVIPYFKER